MKKSDVIALFAAIIALTALLLNIIVVFPWLNPRNVNHEQLADANRASSQFFLAEKAFRTGNFVEAHYQFGRIIDNNISDYDRAIALNNLAFMYIKRLGTNELETMNWDERALTHLREAIRLGNSEIREVAIINQYILLNLALHLPNRIFMLNGLRAEHGEIISRFNNGRWYFYGFEFASDHSGEYIGETSKRVLETYDVRGYIVDRVMYTISWYENFRRNPLSTNNYRFIENQIEPLSLDILTVFAIITTLVTSAIVAITLFTLKTDIKKNHEFKRKLAELKEIVTSLELDKKYCKTQNQIKKERKNYEIK